MGICDCILTLHVVGENSVCSPQQQTIHRHAGIYSFNYMTAIKGTSNEAFWEPRARC